MNKIIVLGRLTKDPEVVKAELAGKERQLDGEDE